MTKNIDRISLKKSKRTTEGLPNLPLPEQLVEGELAINYAKDVETISLKNESGTVVTFSSDNYYTEKKLGSGFTGDNSAKTVTDYITELEGENLWEAGTGLHSVVLKGSSGTASGDYAVAEGHQTSGTGVASHAEGQHTLASGDYSHSEGHYTTANGRYSHVEGTNTTASGESSHAEGYSTTASGSSSHAEGLGTKANGNYSHAEGHGTKANGGSSHAEGSDSIASGGSSHAEGEYTIASGYYSHAEGYSTTASGNSSHAEGYSTKANGGYGSHAEGQSTTANGNSSHAEGQGASAMTDYSHAEGQSTKTGGYASHAEGSMTQAIGNYSHAEGERTAASGNKSHAEGNITTASGDFSHTEGQYTIAKGQSSHAEGQYTTANNQAEHASGQYNVSSSASTSFGNSGNTLFTIGNGANPSMRHNAFEIRQNGDIYIADTDDTTSSNFFEKPMTRLQDLLNKEELWEAGSGANSAVLKNSSGTASGDFAVAEGKKTIASGDFSHAEGGYTTASGSSSHAEGSSTKANGDYSHAEGYSTTASGMSSHAEGIRTTASGNYSHAEGYSTKASGDSSHAEGDNTKASGNYSHAEGYSTTASGYSSHAEGQSTKANGNESHAEGYSTKANGDYSHAEGYQTSASGYGSHAEGYSTKANGNYSHAEGVSTIANNDSEHASGQFNVSNSATTTFGDSGNTLFSVGNGTANNARHNAFEIRQNGDIYIVNKDGDDVRLQDEIGNIDVDQVLDDTTSASTNPVSSKAVYKAVTDNELVWTNAYVVISGAISSHTEDTSIHVTSTDKTNWNAKLDASDIADFFDDAKYEDSGTTKVINFYHGNTIKATIDASDFIVDGMVDDVRIENGNLVIDFNTASGKQDISIPLTDIFDPSNYYNKTEIDNLVGSGFTVSSITEVIIENEEIVSNALTDLDERKLDASAYTPTDLTNYYTKSQTSGATELQTAFGNKANTATTLAGYGITDAYTKSQTSGATELTTEFAKYYTKSQTSGATELETAFNAIDDKFGSGFTVSSITEVIESNERVISSSLNDLNTRKLDASAYTPTDLSNYYTKSETSGKTEISSALDNKVDKTEYATFSAATNASISDLSGQSETVAAALNYLNDNKLDASAYTPTDLTNYYTKSQTSGATELTTAFSAKADKAEDLDGLKLKKITQTAYDALTVKDPNTLYVIVN